MTPSLQVRTFLRAGSIVAATLASLTAVRAYDIPIAPELDGNSTKTNWVSFSTGYQVGIDGNEANYQRRHQHESAGFFGVDSFRYDRTVFGDRTLRIDGKGVVGDNGFLIRAVLKDENNGWYLDAGFKENTIFYCGSGGYSPGGLWIQPFDDQLDLYRGELWLEAGYAKDAWSFRVRGSHQYRKGSKDSTYWGESIYNGLGTIARKTVPALLDVDETRDIIEIDLGYESEKLEGGAGVRIESIEINNMTTVLRNPGQANPTGTGQRYQMNTNGSESDLFSAHGYIVTTVGDRLTLSGAASETTMDSVLSGDRWFAAVPTDPYRPNFPRTSTGHGYNDLHGETQWDQWVITGNAVFALTKNMTLNGGLRYENQTQDSFSEYIETAGPAATPLEEPFEQEGEREFDEALATLELNYTGLNNFVITPFVEYSVGSGSLVEEQMEGHPPATALLLDRETEFDRDFLKIGINGRWYPTKWFNGALGAYTKERNNSYDTLSRVLPGDTSRYPAFIDDQDFTTDDVYVKGTFRASGGLSLTARWDHQINTIETTELAHQGVVSSDQEIDIIAATLNWVATSNISAQIGANFVYDYMETGSVSANTAVASRVSKFASDYITYNAIVMIALDETADLQLDYYEFSADNYRTVYATTLPYGLEAKETVFGITYSKKLSADTIFSLRAVLSDYSEPSSGGNMDYQSEMIYGRLQMRF